MIRILQSILLKILPVRTIELLLKESSITKCKQSVLLGNGSQFYEEAKVVNLQGNRSVIEIGEDTHIRGELVVFAFGGKIKIGSNSYIGEGTVIRSADSIEIGDNVLLSHNCNIIDTDSHELKHLERAEGYRKMIKSGHSKIQGNILSKPIIIEDYAWLSYNVSILKGVRIGKGAIIGAGSIVTKDVPPFTMYAGNPANFIKALDAGENKDIKS